MVPFPSHSSNVRDAIPQGLLVWWCALALFLVAAATGAIYRFGTVYGWTAGLSLTNVRHAHSHLMYFGWATPVLMALVWHYLPKDATRPYDRAFRWTVGATFAAAIVAYPLFLLYGYSAVDIGDTRMPIAVVGAALNILGWYGFVGLYALATQGHPRTPALQLWDMALTFLVLATLGAWGLSLLKPLGLHDPLVAKVLTHVFLDLFSEGWVVMGLLGVARAILRPSTSTERSWAFRAIGAGLPFTFTLALPVSVLPPGLWLLGCLGGALVGAGLLVVAFRLARVLPTNHARWLWAVPLALLGLKAAAQLANSVVPGVWWAANHGLRILYLHVMLLGFVSLGFVAAARHTWGRTFTDAARWFYVAVGLLMLSLVPLTTSWPAAWSGLWTHQAAAWTTLPPWIAAAWMLGCGVHTRRRTQNPALGHPLHADES